MTIDVDEGADPEILTPRWDDLGLAYVVHSTWHHMRAKPGHTEVVPRWRAVFPLSAPVAVRNWPEVYPRLAAYLAGTLWDPSCRDAARIHYLPATMTGKDVLALIREGRELGPDEAPAAPDSPRRNSTPGPGGDGRPGDDYSDRGDQGGVLRAAGWRHINTRGDNEHWCRPGKPNGTSATWHVKRRIFYCFTSSTCLESGRGYDLFGLRAALEGVDHSSLAKALVSEGYGSRPAPPREEVPPPTDADAPERPASNVVQMPAGLPARDDVAKWAGFLSQTAQRVEAVADMVAEPLRAAFSSGASVAVSGGRVTKPPDVCDTDTRRFKRMLAGNPERQKKEAPDLPVKIAKLVRRPVSNRATFDMTVCNEDGDRCVTLTRLDGAAIGSYVRIRELALEHCIAMPANSKAVRDAWDDLLTEAFDKVEEDGVDVEESSLLAMRQEIAGIILDSEVCEKEQDLRRGLVAQDEEAKTIYAWPRALVAKVRARMEADKPSRELIYDAAKLLNVAQSRPTLSDGSRPRVWAFNAEVLRSFQ